MGNPTTAFIEKKTVAIVCFLDQLQHVGQGSTVYYQVTLDPGMVSPSGEMMRFGHNPGDEIIGWKRIDSIAVAEILAEWEGDEPPAINLRSDGVAFVMGSVGAH